MHADNIRNFPERRVDLRYASNRRCTLRVDGSEYDGMLRNISAAGAFVETQRALGIDEIVTLLHPEAGQISARVVRLARDGAALAFAAGEHAATFALSAICADMTIRAIAAQPDA